MNRSVHHRPINFHSRYSNDTLPLETICLDTLNAYSIVFFSTRGAQESIISLLHVSLTFPRIFNLGPRVVYGDI